MPDSGQIDVREPVFAEPWQAQAFAMTMQLSRRGAFTWGDWVEVFSTEIRAHPAQPGEDSIDAYYRQWLTALESILTTRGLSTSKEISEMERLWRAAYLHTPHGMPIALENASLANAGLACGADHDHDDQDDDDQHRNHHHVTAKRGPVAVSPARE